MWSDFRYVQNDVQFYVIIMHSIEFQHLPQMVQFGRVSVILLSNLLLLLY